MTPRRDHTAIGVAAFGVVLLGGAACNRAGTSDARPTAETDDAGRDRDAPEASGGGGAGGGGAAVAPADWVNRGPGLGRRRFASSEIGKPCAFLDGGPEDTWDHHDVVVMFDGYLLLPWAPEFGPGGLTFFDVRDPCRPVVAGSATSPIMRETHSVGFSNLGGTWAVTNSIEAPERLPDGGIRSATGGVMFWDLSDVARPVQVSELRVPSFAYPDGYNRVVFTAFWQGPNVYLAAGDNGVVIVDASDARNPTIRAQFVPRPPMRVHQVQVLGTLLFAAQTGSQALLYDVSDPLDPQPLPNGAFRLADDGGRPSSSYLATLNGGRIYFARNVQGSGGLHVYDLGGGIGPPRRLGGLVTAGGAGGYVFVHEPYVFLGDSSSALVLDAREPGAITQKAQFFLRGDLDFFVPLGNLSALSVDEGAEPDRATALVPWTEEPDDVPPRVTFVVPADQAESVSITARVGVTFSELVDVKGAWRKGAVRLVEVAGGDEIEGLVNVQDGLLNFTPRRPLEAGKEYRFEVPAGIVRDLTGNAIASAFSSTFTTAGAP